MAVTILVGLCSMLVGTAAGAFGVTVIRSKNDSGCSYRSNNVDTLISELRAASARADKLNKEIGMSYADETGGATDISRYETKFRELAQQTAHIAERLDDLSRRQASAAPPLRSEPAAYQPPPPRNDTPVSIVRENSYMEAPSPVYQEPVQPQYTVPQSPPPPQPQYTAPQPTLQPQYAEKTLSAETVPVYETGSSMITAEEGIVSVADMFAKVRELRSVNPQYRVYNVGTRRLEFSSDPSAQYICSPEGYVLPNQTDNFKKLSLTEDVYRCAENFIFDTYRIKYCIADESGNIQSVGEIMK